MLALRGPPPSLSFVCRPFASPSTNSTSSLWLLALGNYFFVFCFVFFSFFLAFFGSTFELFMSCTKAFLESAKVTGWRGCWPYRADYQEGKDNGFQSHFKTFVFNMEGKKRLFYINIWQTTFCLSWIWNFLCVPDVPSLQRLQLIVPLVVSSRTPLTFCEWLWNHFHQYSACSWMMCYKLEKGNKSFSRIELEGGKVKTLSQSLTPQICAELFWECRLNIVVKSLHSVMFCDSRREKKHANGTSILSLQQKFLSSSEIFWL